MSEQLDEYFRIIHLTFACAADAANNQLSEHQFTRTAKNLQPLLEHVYRPWMELAWRREDEVGHGSWK